MTQTLNPNLYVLPEETVPHRYKWTRAAADFLAQNDFLEGRYEIIDGDIISKMGQRPPHSKSVMRLTGYLVASFGAEYVRIQLPVDVSEEDNARNEPEPDGAVLTRPVDELPDDRNPAPADCVLLVEVSDSTVRFDLTRKARLYARAGFPEYWVLDLFERRLLVHRAPQGDAYADVTAYDENETAAPQANGGATIRVGDLLPPSAAPVTATANSSFSTK